MKEPFVTCFALLIALNVFWQHTHGSSHHNRDKTDTRKQPRKNSEVRPLEEDSVDEWKNKRDYKIQIGLNDKPTIVQDKINTKHSVHGKENPLTKTFNVGFIDQTIRPRYLLHQKYIDGFRKVLRKRLKVTPRQEIEFVKDNQDSEAKQDEHESPRYEDVTGNGYSENSNNNDFGNSYVTVIDNVDGKPDTDSYSALTSDVAKSEYTNVENSINEGANEESEMLGEEVNDVMGALTKSDSRINQVVAGGKERKEESDGSPFKQIGTTSGDEVTILDNSKEEYNKTATAAVSPADVTVIENQEEIHGSDNAHSVLSKAAWDAIQQVEKNFSDQDQSEQTEHVNDYSNNGNDGNITSQWPAYSLLPKNVSESNNVKHPGGHLDDLESTLNMFAGAKTPSGYDNMKEKPGNVQNNDDEQKLVVTGEAEEGSQGSAINSQMSQSSLYLNQLEHGDMSKNKSYSYDQNGNVKPESAGDSSIFFHRHEQNAYDGRQYDNFGQSNRPYLTPNGSASKGTALFQKPIKVKPNDVNIIYVKPVHPESPRKNWQANKTISSQNNGFFRRPYSPQAFQSQGHQYNTSNINVIQHLGATLPWTQGNHESTVGIPLNRERGPLVNANNATMQMKNYNMQPVQPIVIASEENEQASSSTHLNIQEHEEDFDVLPQQNDVSYQRVDTNDPSLSTWSAEYHKLVEKLRELYGQAHGGTSHVPGGTTHNNNPEMNDVQQMMKDVSRFHTLFVGRKNEKRGNGNVVEDKEMFFKDLKGDVKKQISNNAGKMNNPLDYLPYIPNRNNDNSNGDAFVKNNSRTRFQVSKHVPGQVRSIEKPIQTLVSTSNSSNLYKQDTNMSRAANANDTGTLEIKANTTFVNQRLADRQLQRSTDAIRLSNTSETRTSNDSGQSSHQVLMTYFRNETVLRKQLHNITDILRMNGFTVGQTTEKKENEEPAGNSTYSSNSTESTRIKEKLHNGGGDATKNLGNDLLPWPPQLKNVSKEQEEGSLAKYLADFISLLSLNNTMNTKHLNETTGGSSNSNVTKPNVDMVSPSDASKKENVTDVNNRVIIVVSPKSLKGLMKNHNHSSSTVVVNKFRPITAGKAENSTANVETSINKTVINVKDSPNSLHGNTTIDNQVSKQQTAFNIEDAASKKETTVSVNKDADLSLLYREELKSLEISLSRDYMSSWIYYQKSLDEIGITPSMLRSGIANLGSPQRLKSVFKKALAGTDVHVLVVGGSISAGGGIEKDRGNVEGVYHKAFSDWWNNTVTPITTSELKVDAVAIGGTDSEYFSYCIKNYMRTLPDIVIWELAANDYQRYKGRNFAPAKPLEQLTRIILGLPSRPALILANFFRGNYYRTAVGQDCPDSEDEGGRTIAQYYKLTSLSWRNVICSPVADQDLDLKKLFSSDGYHPSLLGHAQMSTLLISYLKGVFEQTISQEMTLSRNHTLQSHQQDEALTTLPKPIFDDPQTPRPFCWTLLTPDYSKQLRNTLPDLEFTEATGFQFANISHWPVRRDRLRCLKAIQTGAMLKMKFIVPAHEELDGSNPRSERELAITTHNSFGGMGTIWVDGNQQSAKIITENGGQKRTQVDVLTRTLAPGVHTLTVSALQPGFCLSAVAVL